MRYLGIDYGMRKTGIALSDENGTMGFPKEIVPTNAKLLEHLLAIIETEKIGAVVMGESRNLSGAENPVARHARALSKELAIHSAVPVFSEPETFTTQEARRLPTGERTLTHEHVDAAAAALILTSYLSHNDKN